MAEIVEFTGETTIPEPPEKVLEKAKGWGMEAVMIIGHDVEGNLIWGGSISDSPLINWLLDAAKHELLKEMYE